MAKEFCQLCQYNENPDKRHVLLNTKEHSILKIGNIHIKSFLHEKLLVVNSHKKLNFARHVEIICQKASRKSNAFARLTPNMASSKNRILMNAFFKLQFNYRSLIWMYCDRSLNNKTRQCLEQCQSWKIKFWVTSRKILCCLCSLSNIRFIATETFKVGLLSFKNMRAL